MGSTSKRPTLNRGYIPDNYDKRDRYYTYEGPENPNLKYADLLPQYKDWVAYDQGDTSSCSANATAAAIWFLARKSGGVTSAPSRLFIYYNARALDYIDEKGTDEWPETITEAYGSKIRYCMRVIAELGIASHAKFPWIAEAGDKSLPESKKYDDEDHKVLSINDRPPVAAYEEAALTHAVEYCRLDPDHTDAAEKLFSEKEKIALGVITLARVKQCLAEGYPVVFGIAYLWSADFEPHVIADPLAGDKWRTLQDIPTGKQHKGPDQTNFSGHSVLAVGFDEAKQRVLVKNSWGTGKGADEYFYVPYNWITDFEATDDFWMIRKAAGTSPPSDRRKPPPRPSSVKFNKQGWKLTDWNAHDLDASTIRNSVFAAASRGGNTAEVFWITPSGKLDSMYYYDNKGWLRNTIKWTDGIAAVGAIAAVSRQPSMLEVFWVESNGGVKGSYNHMNGDGWSPAFQLAPPGSAYVKPGGGGTGITAVSRKQGHQEVWWVKPDGSIEGRWYLDGGNGWTGYSLAGPGSAHPESNLTSVATRDHTGMDLVLVWWISPDGRLQGKHLWDNNKGWVNTATKSEPGSAALHTRIAAVSPAPGYVEVYWVSRLGYVLSNVWRNGSDWAHKVVLTTPTARVDSGIAASAVNANRVDVHWVGADDSLIVATGKEGVFQHTKVAGSGSVWAGSPLGIFSRTAGQYSVIFMDGAGNPVVGDVYQ